MYPQLNVLYKDAFLRDLDLICDIHEIEGVDAILYGLEKRKVIEWLKAKLDHVMETLDKSSLIKLYFAKTNPFDMTAEKKKICSALRLLSEYVGYQWIELLKLEYG